MTAAERDLPAAAVAAVAVAVAQAAADPAAAAAAAVVVAAEPARAADRLQQAEVRTIPLLHIR